MKSADTGRAICPVCWHDASLRCLASGREIVHDEIPLMRWSEPRAAAGAQVCSVWDGGAWTCERCGVRMTRHHAFSLLDAVLRVSDPDSDSFDGETFADARRAAAGGGSTGR